MAVGDWLTIVAIVMGPIVGACLAIFLEDLRTKRERKLDVFRNLMRTRRAQLWVDHVTALNLVEVEFYGNKKVIESFKGYIDHLTTKHPKTEEEEYNKTENEHEKTKRDEIYWRRLQKKRDELFVIMVHAIAKSLGFKNMQQLEIMSGGYFPQGWFDIENEQNIIRTFFADIAKGDKILPIVSFTHLMPQSPPESEGQTNSADGPPGASQSASAHSRR